MLNNNKIIAIPPGYTIKEQLDLLNIDIIEFSNRMEIPKEVVSDLLNGKCELSREIANKLEKITGISKEFWINLETNYRSKIVSINE